MAIAHHKAVTTPEAISASIQTDEYVCRWFTHLITQPEIKQFLYGDSRLKKMHQRLLRVTAFEVTVYILLIICLAMIYLTKDPLMLLALALIGFLLVQKSGVRKKLVADLSLKALAKNHSIEELSKMTLFHLSEVYSTKYNIISLVDTVYMMDFLMRRTIIWTFALTCYIYPVTIWQAILWLIAVILVVKMVINLTYVYKKLK